MTHDTTTRVLRLGGLPVGPSLIQVISLDGQATILWMST